MIAKHSHRQRILSRRLIQKGNALVIMLITLPALVGATGLALDWGRGVWVKTMLKRAADSGALTGASFLPDQTTADTKSDQMINANFLGPDDVICTPNGDQYTVQLAETVPTFFMRIFGRINMEVSVSSTARGPEKVGGLRGGAFPFAIINPNLNDNPCDDLTPSNYGRPYVIAYGENNVIVEDWANDCGPIPPNPGNGNSGGSGQGWRAALRLDHEGGLGGSGAADLRDNMMYGWQGEMRIGDTVPTETGNIDGPIDQGRDGLLGSNPTSWSDFDLHLDGHDPRVVLVPIIHLVHANRRDVYTTSDYWNGAPWDQGEVVIDGFAPFFMLTVREQGDVDADGGQNDGDWIVGYYIPGVEINDYLPPDEGSPEYGVYSAPRLID